MRRLPVNLATNPIEHRQWRRRIILRTAAVAVLLSFAQGLLGWSLLDEPQTESPDAEALVLLREWAGEVEALVSTADPRAARRIAVAVGFANAFIDQRVFPWARMFSILEESIPDNVRLEIIQPVTTLDGVRVTLTASSLSGDALLSFLAALEARPEFLAVYPGRQVLGTDREIRLTMEALVRIDREAAVAGASAGDDNNSNNSNTPAPLPDGRGSSDADAAIAGTERRP